MKLLIKNGLVLNPNNNSKSILDILINDSKIKKIEPNIQGENIPRIDAVGKLVVPGLVDVHVHFRQPGQEYKEDIHSGSMAAAAGGFATVITEPNTNPPICTPIRLKKILDIASKQSIVNFYSKACISARMQGERLADIKKLKQAGAKAISDDGHLVPGRELMRRALEKGKEFDILVNPHCEESALYREKILRKQGNQTTFLPQKPYTAEDRFIRRDIELAELTGAHIHISHVSFAKSVEAIANAKKRGIRITAEATPHHFTLTEEMAKEIGPNAKVNPPLRSRDDVEAIKQGLADGTIDIIASDHAPHSPEEKNLPWNQAPFGIIGLETTLGLVLTHLVKPGILTLNQAIEKMTFLPAKIFGLLEDGIGTFVEGKEANITIIDLDKKWNVDVKQFYSKSRNCPFNGWELQGKAVATIVGNRIVMKDEELILHE
jgi:dihydroorotase